jgi:DNA-binding NarL/FixJ family response regulator
MTTGDEVERAAGSVVAVVDDLLFGSKLRAAARAGGRPIHFIRSHDGVLAAVRETGARLVIIDLDSPALAPQGVIEELRASPEGAAIRIVGFARHTHPDILRAARSAGCEAMPRSSFVELLPELMGAAS